jgi:hypothetical protein
MCATVVGDSKRNHKNYKHQRHASNNRCFCAAAVCKANELCYKERLENNSELKTTKKSSISAETVQSI